MRRRKLSDLKPPLGTDMCSIYDRMHRQIPVLKETKDPQLAIKLLNMYNKIEKGEDLDKSEEHKMYSPFTETYSNLDFFKEVYLTTHAQYRMDLRGLSVKELGQVLGRWEDKLKNNRQARKAFNKLAHSNNTSKNLEDKVLKVRLALELAFDESVRKDKRQPNNISQVRVKTIYYLSGYQQQIPPLQNCVSRPTNFPPEENSIITENNSWETVKLGNSFIFGLLRNAPLEVQEIVKRPLHESIDLPFNPYPSYETSISELEHIRYIQDTTEDWNFVKWADEDTYGIFVEYLNELGVLEDGLYLDIETVGESVIPIILKLKYYYNRPRPYQYAQKEGIKHFSMDFETARTPSYPSGHTLQATYIAEYLSDRFPQFTRGLKDLGRRISKTRLQAGVHFPSDCLFGAHLARVLYKGLPTTMRVANMDQQKIIRLLDTVDESIIHQVLSITDSLNLGFQFKPGENLLDLVMDAIYTEVADKTPNKCLDMENMELLNVKGVVDTDTLIITGKLDWSFWLEGDYQQGQCALALQKEYGSDTVWEAYNHLDDTTVYEVEIKKMFSVTFKNGRMSVKVSK